jgi:hypothetical protein
MKYCFMTILFCFLGMFGYGQKGEINFFIIPTDGYEIILDNTEKFATNRIVVDAGEHNLKIFASGYYIFDTTLVVSPHQEVMIAKELSLTIDFTTFLEQDRIYENKLMTYKIPGAFVTAGVLFYATTKLWATQLNYTEIEELKSSYQTATSSQEIEGIKARIVIEQENFNTNNKIFKQSLLVAGITGTITALLWRKANKIVVPTFQDKVQLKFDSYLSQDQQKIINQIGFTYAF